MKKFVLFFAIIIAANYAKAQQLSKYLPPKPRLIDDRAWPKSLINDSLFKVNPEKKAQPDFFNLKRDNAVVFYSRMPVVKPAKGNSRMPVIELGGNMRYNMPVAKIDILNPDTEEVEKVNP